MVNTDHNVYIVGKDEQPMRRLRKLGLLEHIPPENIIEQREVAMELAIQEHLAQKKLI